MSRRVLVVTADTLAPAMAGPAIRAFEISKALAAVADVTLASTAPVTLSSHGFPIEQVDDLSLRRLVANCDVLVFQGHIMQSFPWIESAECLVLADVYDPMHIEQLEQARFDSLSQRVAMTTGTVDALTRQLLRADFLVCASERQRDLWLGNLGGLGRINPATYDRDPTLRSLVDVAPFGLPETPPERTRAAIKGVVPGIGVDDKVVLWGGGIYNWFDPLSVIRAIADLTDRRTDLRLFFLGGQHPNPNVPKMRMAASARELAAQLGVLDTAVFFNEGWVDYQDRANYLLDSDLGVSTHFDNVETDFSFRTRILDYLWAGLPVVTSEGGSLSDLVRERRLGAVVPVGDEVALAAAIESVLYDPDRERLDRIRAVAAEYRWESALRPIVKFCLDGTIAADREAAIEIAANNQIAGLRHRINAMERSLSWQLTAPVRWFGDRVRRRS